MRHALALVAEFSRKFNFPIAASPGIPADKRRHALRMELIREEWHELEEAVALNNLTLIADALGDMVYVILGMALEYGIPLAEVFEEIHRSNLSKVWQDGKPRYREDGKLIKPPTYSRAQLEKILETR